MPTLRRRSDELLRARGSTAILAVRPTGILPVDLFFRHLVELRPLGPQDFDALFSAASDPKIWEQHPESDRYQREVFQRFFDGALESRGAFAIIERESGRIIGSSRYCNLDLTNREVEIGWTFLEREFWGGTYNRELKQLMLDHAFRFVDRVLFVLAAKSYRSFG